jgi:peptide/nickel transport system permease protein
MTPTSSSSLSRRPAASGTLVSPAALVGGLRWLCAKLGNAIIVLWGAATAVFLAQAALPGDRATVILNIRAGQAIQRTPAELAQINEQYGLQHPVVVQYVDYLRGLVSGSLGNSYPQYWLGIILLLVFAVGLHWFPVISGNSIVGLLLPALTLAIPLAGFMGQATRAEFERSLEQPFVISARMRGMNDLGVRLRHVLRHSVLPAVTLSGWGLGVTLSGAVIVESVFSRAGLGQVLVSAVNAQDMPVVTGIVMLVAAIYVVANILVDLIYLLIDPRLKAS